ncbi:hypothetical protein T03_7727 [Trichinella britovi]|uniref:Uncharacterized protein n=1 Tax=Trichinella britovi TaxID=45882 RepID=A0A0V1CYZ9_TRIBR|nr:hypothetical protein T03_7727 [Trichinella britovi]
MSKNLPYSIYFGWNPMRFSDEIRCLVASYPCMATKRMHIPSFWLVHFVRVHKPPHQPPVEYEREDVSTVN